MSKPIEQEVLIKCATEGFDEATEQVKVLAEAYDGFPAQVTIKNCRDCHINIYPTQTKIVELTSQKGENDNGNTD